MHNSEDNVAVAILGAMAMTLNFVWFDLPGHGTVFLQHAAEMGLEVADGHTLFLIGMFATVLFTALAPRFCEQHVAALLIASALIGTPVLGVYCLATSPMASAVAVVLIGLANLAQLVPCFCILMYVINRAMLVFSITGVFMIKTLVTYLADRLLSTEAQTAFVIALPLLSLVCALAARHFITDGALEANAVRIKFEEPLSTVMMGMVLVSSVLFATTRVVSNMGFWGTTYAVSALNPLEVALASALFCIVCYFTLVKTNAQLLFRFLPGLLILFAAYAFLYSGLGERMGLSATALGVFAQYAEVYGEAFVWTVIFLAIRTLRIPPMRIVGIQQCVFVGIELALQQYVRYSDEASLVIVLFAFFIVFGLLIWALWHFYANGRADQGPRCAACIHAAELERLHELERDGDSDADAGTTEEQPGCQVQPRSTTLSMSTGGTGSEVTDVRRLFAEKHGLSERETDVFVLLAQGRSRKFICDELFIADGTASTHIRHVYEKLGVHSKQELLALVYKDNKADA